MLLIIRKVKSIFSLSLTHTSSLPVVLYMYINIYIYLYLSIFTHSTYSWRRSLQSEADDNIMKLNSKQTYLKKNNNKRKKKNIINVKESEWEKVAKRENLNEKYVISSFSSYREASWSEWRREFVNVYVNELKSLLDIPFVLWIWKLRSIIWANTHLYTKHELNGRNVCARKRFAIKNEMKRLDLKIWKAHRQLTNDGGIFHFCVA
jgi:hypothetical protein